MSEGNERNLESTAPEAAERAQIENNESIESEAPQAAPEPAPVPEAEAAEPDAPEAEREAPAAQSIAETARGKGKKRRRSAVVPLAIALVVVLLFFGILVGYGLGRVRGQRGAQEVEAEPTASAVEEAPAYDGFTEELTNQNQMALDALAGEDATGGEDATALMGEEDFLAEEPGEAASDVVVAEYGDGETLTSGEVLEAYNEELSSYILAGFSEDEVAETLLDDVLQSMVSDRVLEEHAREMGVYELSDDDRTQIQAEADAAYEDLLRYYMIGSGGEGEDARSAAEAALMDAEGITREYLAAQMEQDWWKQKLYGALTDSVTVSDDDVQVLYDARLEEQRENFTEYPDDYEFSQSNGETILFNLPGYRAVKTLLLGFDDDEAAMAVFSLTDDLFAPEEGEDGAGEQDDAERQAQLDSYYAGPEVRAKQALEELRGGADMDEMILSIGQDEGMKDERQREMGYYVCANSTLWSEDFVAAAMALENVGDYSEPVRTEDGVCILQYLGEVPEGEVPLADVRDALEEEALNTARDEAYQAQVDAWVAEANPSYYPERMQ